MHELEQQQMALQQMQPQNEQDPIVWPPQRPSALAGALHWLQPHAQQAVQQRIGLHRHVPLQRSFAFKCLC